MWETRHVGDATCGRRQGRHSYQPRATPWVHQPKTLSALKARFILRPTSSNLELPFPSCPVLITIWDGFWGQTALDLPDFIDNLRLNGKPANTAAEANLSVGQYVSGVRFGKAAK